MELNTMAKSALFKFVNFVAIYTPNVPSSSNISIKFSFLFIASIVLWTFPFTQSAQAVPSLARQTGFQCNMCHSPYPQLTPLGREFKLKGYTFSDEETELPPLALMILPSFTNTNKGQPRVVLQMTLMIIIILPSHKPVFSILVDYSGLMLI